MVRSTITSTYYFRLHGKAMNHTLFWAFLMLKVRQKISRFWRDLKPDTCAIYSHVTSV